MIAVALLGACSGPQRAPEEVSPPADAGSRPADAAPPDAGAAVALNPAVDRRDDGTVLLEGTPEIPASLRQRMAQYLDTRGALLADLGSDGKRVLVTTRLADTAQVYWVATPMGARRQLTFGSERAIALGFVPRAGRSVLYRSDVGGNERDQFFRLDVDTGTTTLLTDGTSRNLAPVWSWSGKQLAYSSSARNGVDFDIWIGDGVTAAGARLLCQVEGRWAPLAWSRDDKRLLVIEYVSINEQRIHLVDVATGAVTPLVPDAPPGAYADALFARDGKSVYLTSDREGEFTELYQLELATRTFRPLSRTIPWNIEAVALSADGKALAFTSDEDGYSVLRLLDTRSGKSRRVRAVPPGVITGLRFATRANVLGFSLATPTDSGDVYTYQVARDKLVQWTDSEMGGLAPSSFLAPQLVHYRSFDGAEIPAFYYRPPGSGPFPVVISIHGGPESQFRPRFSSLIQFLVVEDGFAVIAPNVRGSNGYGKTYLTLDNGLRRKDSVKDIGALLDWIATRDELAADRVAVMGGSYGGYMVLAALVDYGSRITAGIDVVGISNFVTFLENTGAYRRDLRRAEYGDERDPEMRAHLEKISPLASADRIQSALFVAQGANDPRVPASEAEQIVSAVRRAGHPVWYMLARNEGHGFRRKENRDIYSALAVLFLETHLGARPSAPSP